MKRLVATLALAAVALAAAACGSGNAAEPSAPPASPADPSSPVIVADQLKFEKDAYTVPAGKAFTLVFENREGPPHNVAIYTDATAKTPIYVGEIFAGPATKSYSVPAITAGTYFFRCDVHPDMKGTITAG